jgi:hypothetical protein
LSQVLNKVDLPTYSPDMNRAIEHVFGDVKERVRVAVCTRGNMISLRGLKLGEGGVGHIPQVEGGGSEEMTLRACPCCGACSVLQLGWSLSTPRTTSMWELVGGIPPLGISLVGQKLCPVLLLCAHCVAYLLGLLLGLVVIVPK